MGFRLPARKTAQLDLGGPEYAGAEVFCRLNAPVSTALEIQAWLQRPPEEQPTLEERAEFYRAFGDALLESWNLEDRMGNPLPADGDGMTQLDGATAETVLAAWLDKVVSANAPLAAGPPGGGP